MTLYKKRLLPFVKFLSSSIMNSLKASSVIAVVIMSFLSTHTSANNMNKLDKTQSLLSSCNAFKAPSNKARTLLCIIYIEGYLNGVLIANKKNVEILLENNNESATLVERAYANRVGNKARSNHKSNDLYCISMVKSKKHIIDHLSDSSLSSVYSLEELNARLAHILEASCSAENNKSKSIN